jgi:hypothetical protein
VLDGEGDGLSVASEVADAVARVVEQHAFTARTSVVRPVGDASVASWLRNLATGSAPRAIWWVAPGINPYANLYDPAANNRGHDIRYWYPKPEGSHYRFLWNGKFKKLGHFNATFGEERGSYLANAKKQHVLDARRSPAFPEPHLKGIIEQKADGVPSASQGGVSAFSRDPSLQRCFSPNSTRCVVRGV